MLVPELERQFLKPEMVCVCVFFIMLVGVWI
jgi:hypothetical protein